MQSKYYSNLFKKTEYPNPSEINEIFEEIAPQLTQLQEYRRSKTKFVVLNDSAIQLWINNTKKYYQLDETPSLKDVKDVLFDLIIKSNGELFYKNEKDELISKNDIFRFEMLIPKDELQKVLLKSFKISTPGKIKDFFEYQLLNSLTTTTSLFFMFHFISSSQIKITLNPLSQHFEREGNYFYNLYYQELYKSKLCSTYISFEEFINEIKKKYKKSENSNEYKLAYEYKVLNCNLFVCNLFSSVLNKVAKKYSLTTMPGGITTDAKYIEYIKNKIKKCDLEFILIPMNLKYPEGPHQNILLVDLKNKTVERYDPHGILVIEKQNQLNKEIKDFFDDLGYVYSTEFCKADPIQNIEDYIEKISIKDKRKTPIYYTGRCVSYAYNYLDYRLNEKSTKEAITKYSRDTVMQKGISYLMDVVNKNNQIFNSMQNKLDIINQIFGSKLKFTGNILTSGGECECKSRASPRAYPKVEEPKVEPKKKSIPSPPKLRKKPLKGITKKKKISPRVFTGPRGGLYIKKGDKKVYL